MNKRRLLKLAKFLENLSPHQVRHFDMDQWRKKQKCGSAQCAIGWAAQIPEFKKAGLTMVLTPTSELSEGTHIPAFNNYEHWEAVKKFFDLSSEKAEYLFSTYSYNDFDDEVPIKHRKGVNLVSKRIRHFVKTGKVYDSIN